MGIIIHQYSHRRALIDYECCHKLNQKSIENMLSLAGIHIYHCKNQQLQIKTETTPHHPKFLLKTTRPSPFS